MRSTERPGSILLTVAFAALLAVMGGSAIAGWKNATNAQQRAARLHQAHLEAGAALSAIRANVYLSAILTRDYLLDSDPADARQYIQQFAAVRTKTEESLGVLAASGQDEDQRAALNQLRKELEAYWDPTEIELDWTPRERQGLRGKMLQQRLARRQQVFALANQIEQMITTNFNRERQRVFTADQEFRSSLGWITAVALLFGLGVAGITLNRMLALERKSRAAESELRLLSGQIRTAQEEERKYLSRELHDQVGQMLTGLRMELASMTHLLTAPAGELALRIAHSKGIVEQTLRMIRDIAMLLRPSMLDDLGLTPALTWLVKEMSRSSGIEITCQIDDVVDLLPDPHRTCLYRVVQEALTNASRHSGARSADVTVKAGGEWVTGVVADDGKGFDMGQARNKGLGLLGMEERVRELGGSVRLSSSAGRGTRVEIRLPRPIPSEVKSDSNPDSGRPRDRAGRIEASA